jgi:hypothetical protein
MKPKKLLLSGIAALFLATGTAHAVDWKYDYRRCYAGHMTGDFYVRISSEGFMDVSTSDMRNVDFKVTSVRIGQINFPADPEGYGRNWYRLGPEKPLFRALEFSKHLQVFAKGQDKPVVDLRYTHGRETANFLRKCG